MTRNLAWFACLAVVSTAAAQLPSTYPPVRPAGPVVLPPTQSPALPQPQSSTEGSLLPRSGSPAPFVFTPPTEAASATELKLAIEKLKTEREALVRQRQSVTQDAASASKLEEMTMLRLKIAELIGRLGERGKSDNPRTPPDPPPAEKLPEQGTRTTLPPITPASGTLEPVSKLTLAQTHYQAGDADTALRELKQIDINSLARKERVWVQYLMAGCLRKQGNLADAAVLYREVADAREDDFLTDSAVWHLGLLRWRQDIQKQLDDARKRRESR